MGRHGVRVDGYGASTQTVYEFSGCYWRGLLCLPNTGCDLQRERLAKPGCALSTPWSSVTTWRTFGSVSGKNNQGGRGCWSVCKNF